MNASERKIVYGIPNRFYTNEEVKLLMDDLTGRKRIDKDMWATIIDAARKRLNSNEPVADIGDKK